MATVTKPIALDESINTTEQTPRNIADVLAEELKGIADSITTAESVEDILSDMATTKDSQIINGTAVFNTVDGNLVKALKVAITPSQAGSGTPSPSNIRPISGYTEEVISVKDSTDTTQETYTTPFNQTVYGGTLDVLTGELTIDKVICTASDFSAEGTSAGGLKYRNYDPTNFVNTPSLMMCNVLPYITGGEAWTGTTPCYTSNATRLRVYYETGTWGDYSNIQVLYPLATPTTLSLTPQTVKSLVGENHIQASTGDVLQCRYSMMINGEDLAQLLT